MAKKKTNWKDRIVGEDHLSPSEILDNPLNFRKHSAYQASVMTATLDKIGWVQKVIVNKRTGLLIDGHLRVALARERGEDSVPVVYVDLSPNEEKTVLSTLDPIGALAEVEKQQFEELVREIDVDHAVLQEFLSKEFEKNDAAFFKEVAKGRKEKPTPTPGIDTKAEAPIVESNYKPPQMVTGTPVIQYSIIFDDEKQKALFFAFLRKLREMNPDTEITIAELICNFITDNVEGIDE